MTGAASDAYSEQRSQDLTQTAGPFAAGYLISTVRAQRVDWLYGVAPTPTPQPTSGPPGLGDFAQALPAFADLIARWLDVCPPLTRIAFGARLLVQVQQNQSAARLLSERIAFPKLSLDDNVREFLLQMNRATPSRVTPPISLHTIRKWSETAWALGTPVPGEAAFQFDLTMPSARTVDLELDFSTAAEAAAFITPRNRIDLWRELVHLGSEVAEGREG